jgi:precorrin-6B methylase 1
MPNPTAAMLVIGDEILSGRTRDANMHHLAQELTKVGINLREVTICERLMTQSSPRVALGRPMTTSPPIVWRQRLACT